MIRRTFASFHRRPSVRTVVSIGSLNGSPRVYIETSRRPDDDERQPALKMPWVGLSPQLARKIGQSLIAAADEIQAQRDGKQGDTP